MQVHTLGGLHSWNELRVEAGGKMPGRRNPGLSMIRLPKGQNVMKGTDGSEDSAIWIWPRQRYRNGRRQKETRHAHQRAKVAVGAGNRDVTLVTALAGVIRQSFTTESDMRPLNKSPIIPICLRISVLLPYYSLFSSGLL